MYKLPPQVNAVNHGIKGVVILQTPGGSCWQCEQKLPPEPRAVAVTALSRSGLVDFVFLICSENCDRALKLEVTRSGRAPRSMPPAKVTALLRAPEDDVVGVVEGWQGPDRPYYLIRGPLFDSFPQREKPGPANSN